MTHAQGFELVTATRETNEHLRRLVNRNGYPASDLAEASARAAFG